MRLSPPITVIAMVAVALSLLAVEHRRETENRRVTCKVALTVLKNELEQVSKFGGRAIVADGPSPHISYADFQERLRGSDGAKIRNHPDFSLHKSLAQRSQLRPLDVCPQLKGYLRAQNTLFGDKLIDREVGISGVNDRQKYKYIIVAITIPGIAMDGKRAMTAVSQVFGPLAGGGQIIITEIAPDGSIRIIDQYGTWIS